MRTHWNVIALLALATGASAGMRTVFGPVQEAAKLELGFTDFQISLVQGIAVGVTCGLVSFPIAWVTDHGNRMRLTIALIGLCVVGTIGTAYATDFPTMFVARMLTAIGSYCVLGNVISLAADLSAKEIRGRSLLVVSVGILVGIAVAFVLGGKLVGYLEAHPIGLFGHLSAWREIHVIFGIAGALMLLPLFLMREPERHEVEFANPTLRRVLDALWARRAFIIPLFIGQLAVSMADTAATIWAAPVLIRDFHQTPNDFAGWMGGIILVGGIAGAVLGGISADWGQKLKMGGGILIGAVAATAISIPAALYPVAPSVTLFAVALGVLLLAGSLVGLVASTTIAIVIPNEERGISMAVFGVLNSVVGLGLAPTLVSLVSNAMGGEQHLALALTWVGVVTCVLSFVGYVFAMRHLPARH